jgi:hypothetical protein
MDLRELQRPLKEQYRADPSASRITLTARGGEAGAPQPPPGGGAQRPGVDEVIVEGDLDLRGTLGIDREVSAGFNAIRVRFDIDAPGASAEDIEGLMKRTERYCTVLQTLVRPPEIEVVRARAAS